MKKDPASSENIRVGQKLYLKNGDEGIARQIKLVVEHNSRLYEDDIDKAGKYLFFSNPKKQDTAQCSVNNAYPVKKDGHDENADNKIVRPKSMEKKRRSESERTSVHPQATASI